MVLQPPAPLLLAVLATAAALPADSGTALMDMHQVRGFKPSNIYHFAIAIAIMVWK